MPTHTSGNIKDKDNAPFTDRETSVESLSSPSSSSSNPRPVVARRGSTLLWELVGVVELWRSGFPFASRRLVTAAELRRAPVPKRPLSESSLSLLLSSKSPFRPFACGFDDLVTGSSALIAFFKSSFPSALSCVSRLPFRTFLGSFLTGLDVLPPLVSSIVSARLRRIAARLAANAFVMVGSAAAGTGAAAFLLLRSFVAETARKVESIESRRAVDLRPLRIAARLSWTPCLSRSTPESLRRLVENDARDISLRRSSSSSSS